jgi:2-phospho-L-lactate guanylyltransferase
MGIGGAKCARIPSRPRASHDTRGQPGAGQLNMHYTGHRWRRIGRTVRRVTSLRSRQMHTSACWALVPIKARGTGKSRLAQAIGPEAREQLVTSMLMHVLKIALNTPGIDRVLLVSPEPELPQTGLALVQDSGHGLNPALEQARRYAMDHGARAIIALAADLPFLSVAELRTLLRAGHASGIAIASDRHGSGTNALYLEPPNVLPFAFGPGSFLEHRRRARRIRIQPRTVRRYGLLWDIDTPQDLSAMQRRLQKPDENLFV